MNIKITEQQFFDFMFCPAYFEMKNVKKLGINESTTLKNLLSKVAKYFYLSILNGRIPTTNDLKKKWDSICASYQGQLDNKKILEGMGLIFKLYNWAHQTQPVVLDIDSRYSIQVDGVELTGNMGTILSAPNGQFELLITDFSNRLPDQSMIDMKLKYTLQAYSFEKTYQKPISGIRVHSVKYDRDFFTSRNVNDYKRLETAIKNVGLSIEQGLHYPREGMCSTCPAKGYCKYWYC